MISYYGVQKAKNCIAQNLNHKAQGRVETRQCFKMRQGVQACADLGFDCTTHRETRSRLHVLVYKMD